MTKKEYLLKVRRSRKAYWLNYLLGSIILILILFFSVFQNRTLSRFTWTISIIFILLMIKLPEVHRLKDWWGVTTTSLVQSLGILDKNIREVDFSSISDLDINQPMIKRILGYGDVNVRLFLAETSICIKDINQPEKFLEKLQEIIIKHKKYKHGIGNI